jgi:hypothetical protein
VLASVQYIQAPRKKFLLQGSSPRTNGEGFAGNSFIVKHPFSQQLINTCVGLDVQVTSDYHRPVCGNPIPAGDDSSELK